MHPIMRPHLEAFTAAYQWPFNVEEDDMQQFVERWQQHWHSLCAQAKRSKAAGEPSSIAPLSASRAELPRENTPDGHHVKQDKDHT